MNKKELLKQKQNIKKQQKQERENIINNYINQIKDVIDEGYIVMMSHIDEFNENLINNTIEYSNLEKDITKFLKNEIDRDLVDNINQRISDIENTNDEIYKIITTKDVKNNMLLRHLPVIAKNVTDIITKANAELNNNKNRFYLVSSITNRSFDVFKRYNSVIIDIALESNSYIDVYSEARESFVNFIEKCKDTLENPIIDNTMIENEIEQFEKAIKYKQRLRVTYNELEKFLKHKGFECNRQGNTTHAVWKNYDTGKSIPVPNKSGTICQGTTSKVLKQIGSNRQELANFLYA